MLLAHNHFSLLINSDNEHDATSCCAKYQLTILQFEKGNANDDVGGSAHNSKARE